MTFADRYDSLFEFYGHQYGMNWHLLKKQAGAESSFNPDAESSAGAKGLCQFMPPTFDEWAKKTKLNGPDIWNPEHQIHCQAAYMQWLMDQVRWDTAQAFAAYNFGIGHIKRGDPWPQETLDYVGKILAT